MTSPPVVIDMGMSEPAPALVQSMVEACGKAVPEGACHLVGDAPQGPYRAIAILTWEGPDRVRIEVGIRRDVGTEWRTRALTFKPEDAEVERFRSVGFVVGTLAGEEEPPPETGPRPPVTAPPPPVEAPPPRTIAPKPPVRRETPPPAAVHGVGLLATLGGALDRGAPRYGLRAQGRWGFSPWLGVVGALGGSFRPRDARDLELRFLDAGVGLGVVLFPASPVGCELDVQTVVEHFRAAASSAGASDASERWLPALRADLSFAWAATPRLDFSIAGEATARPAATTVVVQGEKAGSTGLIELGLAMGARLRL